MLSEKQIEERKARTKICVEALLWEGLNQSQIAAKYQIPSSTVGRLLNNEEVIREIYGANADFVIEEIKIYNQRNKMNGNVLGGKTSSILNEYTKDTDGKFSGSKKRL